MSFTTGKRVSNQKPCKAIADMNILTANADDLISKTNFSGVFRVCKNEISSASTDTALDLTTDGTSSQAGYIYDTDSYWSNSHVTRITAPSSVNYLQFKIFWLWSWTPILNLPPRNASIWLSKNGGTFNGEARAYWDEQEGGTICSPVTAVTGGSDYFEVIAYREAGLATHYFANVLVSVRGWK